MDIASLLIPLLLTGAALWALRKRIDVYDALTAGASEGLLVLARIAPSLIALLTAVYMLRASGALTLLTRLLTPVLERLGIPPETAALLLVRPVSGSGALAVGSQLMEQYGPDAYIGRVTAVRLGCSETTVYTVAVYYGAAGIRRTRHTVPAALAAELQYSRGIAAGDGGRRAALTVVCGDVREDTEGPAIYLTEDCGARQTPVWTSPRAAALAVPVPEPLAAVLTAAGKWQISDIHITDLLDIRTESHYNAT